MPSKRLRHARIVDIVGRQPISSQDELSSLLRGAGIRVTQSTLSRDIRELGLVKIRGTYKRSPEWSGAPDVETVRRSCQQLVLQTSVSGNILMVRTAPGNAHSMGVVLDATQWPEILGTVAGDDTVFVLLRNARAGKTLLRRIEGYLA